MGLLDVLQSDDGRFGMSLLAAAAPRVGGGGFGQRLQEAVGTMDAHKKQQMIAEIQKLQLQKAQSEADDQQSQRAQQQQMQEMYKRFATPGQNAVPAIAGDAEAGILPSQGQPGKPAGYDYQGLAGAMAATDPIKALQLQQMLVKQGPKFSTSLQYDQQGNAFVMAEDGSMKRLDGVKARDKLEEVNLGGKVGFRSPYEAALRAEIPKTQTLESLASNAVAMRGQNMTDARSKEANNIQQQSARTQIMQTPEGLIAVDKGMNQAVPVTMGGAPVRSEDAMKKTANAKNVLSLLDVADKLLPKATGGAIGTGVDVALGLGNISTKGAQSTAQLKAIEGQLIASMPRMEGPQSDADRLLYQQAAGDLANSMKPVATRQAASRTLRELQQKYASGGGATGGWSIQKVN